MRIGINGFGRIGRNFTKALLERYPEMEIAAVNDLTSAAECAHLFKWDSNYGAYDGEVGSTADAVTIDGRTIKVLAERDPGKLRGRTSASTSSSSRPGSSPTLRKRAPTSTAAARKK